MVSIADRGEGVVSNDTNKTRRCAGIKSSGKRCERVVGASQTYCFAHDPEQAARRSENASKAARTKHATPRDEILEIREQMKELAEQVRTRKVTPGIGSVVNQILGNVLKTFGEERKERELAELEERLAEVERMHQRKRDVPTDDNPFNAGGGWAR